MKKIFSTLTVLVSTSLVASALQVQNPVGSVLDIPDFTNETTVIVTEVVTEATNNYGTIVTEDQGTNTASEIPNFGEVQSLISAATGGVAVTFSALGGNARDNTSLDNELIAQSNALTLAYAAADVALSNALVSAFQSDDVSLSNALVSAYVAADVALSNALVSAFQSDDVSLSNALTSAYAAADVALSNALVSAYAAADVSLSNALTSAYQSADVALSNALVNILNTKVDANNGSATNLTIHGAVLSANVAGRGSSLTNMGSYSMGVLSSTGSNSLSVGSSIVSGDYGLAQGQSSAAGKNSSAFNYSTAQGENTFSAGTWAYAFHSNSFVFSTGQEMFGEFGDYYYSNGTNTFNLYATGGIFLDGGVVTAAKTVSAPNIDSNTVHRTSNGSSHSAVTNNTALLSVLNPDQIVTVAKAGADYTTIQGAMDSIVDASESKPYAVLVHPGVYNEAVVMSNWVSLVGAGGHEATKITQTNGDTITAPSSGSAAIIGLTLEATPTALNSEIINMTGGDLHVHNCEFNHEGSTADTHGRTLNIDGGEILIDNCEFVYSFSSTSATFRAAQVFDIDGTVTFELFNSRLLVNYADGNDAMTVVSSTAASDVNFYFKNNVIAINMTNGAYSSTAVAITVNGSGGNRVNLVGNDIRITSSGGSGSGLALNMNTSTDDGVITATANNITVEGFNVNRAATVQSGDLIYSHFNHIDVTDANSGAGTVDSVGSPTNGFFGFDVGANIDEFSTDGTLSGNSDTAVPTEKAVATSQTNFVSKGDDISTLNDDRGYLTTETQTLAQVLVQGSTAASDMTITGKVELAKTAASAGQEVLELIVDAAGFGDVAAMRVEYDSGAITTGQDEAVMLVDVDRFNSTGGDVYALEVLATEGAAGAYGLKVGPEVAVFTQDSGTFTDMDSAETNGVSALVDLTNSATSITMFEADNDTLVIGDAAKFEDIEIIVSTGANPGITPTFEYSTGVGTWAAFTPTDGTDGLRFSGVISWADADIPAWATGAGSEYLIRITRTRNTLPTSPVVDFVQISAVTQYSLDENGDLAIRGATLLGPLDMSSNNVTNLTDLKLGGKLYLAEGDTNSWVEAMLDGGGLVTNYQFKAGSDVARFGF